MIKYRIGAVDGMQRLIHVQVEISRLEQNEIFLQLPSWRPGRYELGNFAKNILGFQVKDTSGKPVAFQKVTKDRWQIDSHQQSTLIIQYHYYASQPDAGGCYADDELLYVNPVHCCMYMVGREHENIRLEVSVPGGWKVAGSLNPVAENIFSFENFDRLADSPFFVSPGLKHDSYSINGTPFHIWIHGDCEPDFERIKKDFKAFSEIQLSMMGSFPFAEYHFLILALPFKFYHGVEHLSSTVIAIGPADELMTVQYPELVGVASHELFHVWNVKTIRPAAMLPYDFTKENYSELGWVYEGFTTYYGDLFLARSGFFSLQQYLDEISARLQKHLDNPGRFNYSVSQSSFDTWLDGYVPGVPGRKTSIYDEGSLLALMLDLHIRAATQSEKSLDDVMRLLYNVYGKKQTGYREADLIKVCEEIAGISLLDFINKYVKQAISYESKLSDLLHHAGLEIKYSSSPFFHERSFGIRLVNNSSKVALVLPGSPAAYAGICKDDEIILVNGAAFVPGCMEKITDQDQTELEIKSLLQTFKVSLKQDTGNYFIRCQLLPIKAASMRQKAFFKQWTGLVTEK